ncbi:MAG: hypothetical protein JNJ94_06355 [Chlorobi bacterium]|nr:hypothetical protein [Chlorobiota bacterium]
MKHETRKIAYNNGYRDGWKDVAELVISLLKEDGGAVDETTMERIERELGVSTA